MDVVRHCVEHVLLEFRGSPSVSCRNDLGDHELRDAVDTVKEKQLALGCLHFGDANEEELDRLALELVSSWLVPLNNLEVDR